MSDIVITEFMDEAVVRTVFAGRDVLYDPDLVDKPEALLAALHDCRALVVRNRTQVRGALLAAAPSLAMVARLGVGLDNIDVEACRARGITVRPATGANDLAVAEYVITAALMLLRRSWFASERVIAGQWPRMDLIGHELAGKTMGLIGFGAIARLTAQKAQALGMATAAYDPHLAAEDAAWGKTRRLDLADLLSEADVISLHVPLTAQTTRMIDGEALLRVRPGAILINAARGGVVDEVALVEALHAGRLAGAALDTFETEPVKQTGGERFRGVPNLILTPHIAGVTEESNTRVSEVIAAAVVAALGG